MRIRTLIFALLGTIGAVPSLDAQYIRIGNAEAIPNRAVRPPTILKSTPARYTDEARSRSIEGTVTILAEVSSDGEIKYTRVVPERQTHLNNFPLVIFAAANHSSRNCFTQSSFSWISFLDSTRRLF